MPGGRPKSLDLDKAMPVIVRLFWDGGYGGPTLDEVAGELGVTKPTLYRALGEKDAIFSAALEAYHHTYVEPCEQHWKHGATLHKALEGCFAVIVERILDEDLPCGCFMGDTADSPFLSESIATTIGGLQQRMFSILHGRVERAIEDGELEPTTSALSIVQFVLSQFSALAAMSRTNPTRADLDAVVGYILAGLPWAKTD